MRWFIIFLLFFIAFNVGAADTDYFVKNGGTCSDSNTGLTDAQAWCTISQVKSFTFASGDNVYLKCDSTWNEQLIADWDGTSIDSAIISSYYGTTSPTLGSGCNGGNLPNLNGTFPTYFDVPSALPTDHNGALLQVHADYTHVSYVSLTNSAGWGYLVANNGNYHNNIFEYSYIDNSEDGNTQIKYTAYENIIRFNTLSRCGQGRKLFPGIIGDHPGCNSANGSARNIFEGNLITSAHGEALSAFGAASVGNIYKDNIVAGYMAVGIYMDNASNSIIENNMIIGDPTGDYDRSDPGYQGAGIQLQVEGHYAPLADAKGHIVRNNLISRSQWGFATGRNANVVSETIGGRFIGNTMIGVKKPVLISSTTLIDSTVLEVANNNFYDYDDEPECNPTATTYLDMHHNNWGDNVAYTASTIAFTGSTITDSANGLSVFSGSTYITVKNSSNNNVRYTISSVTAGTITVSESVTTETAGASITLANLTDIDCAGIADIGGNPNLNTSTDFRLFGPLNLATAFDYTPQTGSNTSNVGDDFNDTTIIADPATDYPLYTTLTNFFDTKEMTYDYSYVARHATTPDIGALEITGDAAPTPDTLPVYINVGGAEVIGTVTYEAERGHITPDDSGTVTITTPIAGTTDDQVYQDRRGSSTAMSWKYYFADTTNLDLTIHLVEQYWGDDAGTCVGGERRFNVVISGVTAPVTLTDVDICAVIRAANTAYELKINNLTVSGTSITITTSPGSSGDTTAEISGFSMVTATSDVLTVANATVSHTITNIYSTDTNINPIALCGVTTTASGGVVTIDSLNTTGMTAPNTATIQSLFSVDISLENADTAGGIGSFVATFGDSAANSDTCTISLNVQAGNNLYFRVRAQDRNSIPVRKYVVTNSTGWQWCAIPTVNRLIDGTGEPICGTLETTDANGIMEIKDGTLIVGTYYRIFLYNATSITVNTDSYKHATITGYTKARN